LLDPKNRDWKVGPTRSLMLQEKLAKTEDDEAKLAANLGEAKTQLSRLIAAVERGEEVVIARRDKPVVRLVIERNFMDSVEKDLQR
jgi:ABC-type Na+ efflux pump permease subunit